MKFWARVPMPADIQARRLEVQSFLAGMRTGLDCPYTDRGRNARQRPTNAIL
jgi:hypothetical protein